MTKTLPHLPVVVMETDCITTVWLGEWGSKREGNPVLKNAVLKLDVLYRKVQISQPSCKSQHNAYCSPDYILPHVSPFQGSWWKFEKERKRRNY
jgi:hypothetical protein